MARKVVGFVFIEGFADWEFGFISGSAEDGLDIRPIALTPESGSVVSIGGFQLIGSRGLTPEENTDLDAVAVIGSDGWAAETCPDVAPLLNAVTARGGVVGGICAGTLALARAGLFMGRAHTSNGRDWITHHVPGYAGAEQYRDVPYAVSDGRIVSAPGTAPGTFAVNFLEALLPEKKTQLAQMRALLAAEYGGPPHRP